MLPEEVARPKLEVYKEQFKEYFILERRNGIIMARMHTDGGPALWSWGLHGGISQLFRVLGNDSGNEVIIFTGTGDQWMASIKPSMWEADEQGKIGYDNSFYDAARIMESIVFDVDIPTIGVINGPTPFHTEIGLLCDLTICAEDVTFKDPHFPEFVEVPGDGQFLTFQMLVGLKRSAYLAYMGNTIDAKTALEWGLVNEVLPRERLMDRAWEIAEAIVKAPRVTRRLTSQLVKRPLQAIVLDSSRLNIAYEMYAHLMKGGESWRKA